MGKFIVKGRGDWVVCSGTGELREHDRLRFGMPSGFWDGSG